MAQLYTLLFGTSKKRMHPIMTDVLHKVENLKEQREKTKGSKVSKGWHKIIPAEAGANIKHHKSCTVGGNRSETVARVDKGKAGWIGKGGFTEHT